MANVKGKQKRFGRSHGPSQELEEGFVCLKPARKSIS
jgi:hypothetical protein